jgi:ubiquinone/menaquinone biosynthesis C-methylase UbiE
MVKKLEKWDNFYNKRITLKAFLGNYYSYEIFEEIINTKPKTILEVGSGTGVMSIFLSHLGYKVTSIDNNKKVLDHAKKNSKKFNGAVKFELGDAFKLKYKEDSFDIIYSQGFFEHFPDLEIKKLLDEQLRVAKKAVIITIPNSNYPIKDFGNERLLPLKYWIKLIKELSGKKVEGYNYQFMLRKNMPFRTIFNLITNRKIGSIIKITK